MRIVFDHGMGAMTGAGSPASRTTNTDTGHHDKSVDSVMIIHTGEGARNHRLENGLPLNPRETGSLDNTDRYSFQKNGISIPGTNLVVETSDAAKYRDAEVRGHEKAHLQALGPYAASGINLTTQRSPDGRNYAVGGSVKIDSSPVPGDPEATLRKAQSIIHAANAPGNPSAADMRVASQAYRMAAAAKGEIRTNLLA